MKIRPLFDRIVVQHIESSETTPFGLILPSAIKKIPNCSNYCNWRWWFS